MTRQRPASAVDADNGRHRLGRARDALASEQLAAAHPPLGLTWTCASGEIRAMSVTSACAPLVVSSARRVAPGATRERRTGPF
ncbi:MAG TPA: hypothetical protein VF516_20610 [Kofleriaceae bacterium]